MNSPSSPQHGVMLLEALVAILLISFGILGLIALWAASLKGASEAKYRTDASFLANEMIGQMWLDRANVTTTLYSAEELDGPSRGNFAGRQGNGRRRHDGSPTSAPLLRTTVTVQWTLPGDVQHTFISVAQINGAGAM